ncbi:MAG: CcmD family protein [Cyclobacteriaceae bacterium]|nr:CcmD family protein [Cyclobacteriaceae bacterium]
MKKINSVFLLLMAGLTTYAQEPTVEMADTFRSEGKIYVVVAIVLLILVGLIGYLIAIDRKTSRLEKKLEENSRS